MFRIACIAMTCLFLFACTAEEEQAPAADKPAAEKADKTSQAENTSESQETQADKEKKSADSLHDLMEGIKDDFKIVYKNVKEKDATKKADTLKAVARLKSSAEKAKTLLPHKVEDIADAEEQKKMKAAYVKEMGVMISSLDTLKSKVDADDWDGAMTVVKQMSAHKKESHETFQDDDEEHDHEH